MEKEDVKHYQRGFNEGWIVAKYTPELSEMLSQIKGNSTRLEGFLDGIEQYTKEQAKEIVSPSDKFYGETGLDPVKQKDKDIEREP